MSISQMLEKQSIISENMYGILKKTCYPRGGDLSLKPYVYYDTFDVLRIPIDKSGSLEEHFER